MMICWLWDVFCSSPLKKSWGCSLGMVKWLGAGLDLRVGKDIDLFGRIGLFRVKNDTWKQDMGNPGGAEECQRAGGECKTSNGWVVETEEVMARLGRVLGRQAGNRRLGVWGQDKAAGGRKLGMTGGGWESAGSVVTAREYTWACWKKLVLPPSHRYLSSLQPHVSQPLTLETWLVPMESPLVPRPPSVGSTAWPRPCTCPTTGAVTALLLFPFCCDPKAGSFSVSLLPQRELEIRWWSVPRALQEQ